MQVVYEVETKHTEDILKQYVKFQNGVITPTKKFQSFLITLCVLALMLLVPYTNFRIGCVIIAALIVLRTLLDDWFMVRYLKKEDNNYKKQNIIRYQFGKDRFHMDNPNEEESLSLSYKDVRALYKDDKYWYLCMKGGELHIFAQEDVVNTDHKFGIFLEKQTGLKMRSANITLKDKVLIMQGRQEEFREDKNKKAKRGIL